MQRAQKVNVRLPRVGRPVLHELLLEQRLVDIPAAPEDAHRDAREGRPLHPNRPQERLDFKGEPVQRNPVRSTVSHPPAATVGAARDGEVDRLPGRVVQNVDGVLPQGDPAELHRRRDLKALRRVLLGRERAHIGHEGVDVGDALRRGKREQRVVVQRLVVHADVRARRAECSGFEQRVDVQREQLERVREDELPRVLRGGALPAVAEEQLREAVDERVFGAEHAEAGDVPEGLLGEAGEGGVEADAPEEHGVLVGDGEAQRDHAQAPAAARRGEEQRRLEVPVAAVRPLLGVRQEGGDVRGGLPRDGDAGALVLELDGVARQRGEQRDVDLLPLLGGEVAGVLSDARALAHAGPEDTRVPQRAAEQRVELLPERPEGPLGGLHLLAGDDFAEAAHSAGREVGELGEDPGLEEVGVIGNQQNVEGNALLCGFSGRGLPPRRGVRTLDLEPLFIDLLDEIVLVSGLERANAVCAPAGREEDNVAAAVAENELRAFYRGAHGRPGETASVDLGRAGELEEVFEEVLDDGEVLSEREPAARREGQRDERVLHVTHGDLPRELRRGPPAGQWIEVVEVNGARVCHEGDVGAAVHPGHVRHGLRERVEEPVEGHCRGRVRR